MAGEEREWEEIEPEEAEPEAEEQGGPEAPGGAPYEVAPPQAPVQATTDRSRYAMFAGLGFFILGLFLYFLVVVPGDGTLAALTAAGMGLTAASVYFWMAHDLRIRPKAISRHLARFITGPLLGLLAIVGLASLVVYVGPGAPADGWQRVATLFGLEFGTAASVSLLFYSMMWDR